MARQKRLRRQVLKEYQERKAALLAKGALNGRAPFCIAPPPRGSPAEEAHPPPESERPFMTAEAPPAQHMPPPPNGQPFALSAQNGGEKRSIPQSLEWVDAGKRYRCFAVARGFLGMEDINSLHACAQHPSVLECNDRKGYLAFLHKVWRFEPQLRALSPDLYNRLIGLMQRADSVKWRRLRKNSKKNRVYPEIEYIRYDVWEMDSPCFIEPHVDNKSAVTLVAMLSSSDEYEGGISCFRRADGTRGSRQMALQQGDVVLFRGEKLTHWITPVTAGRRVILQIELSRV